MLLNLLRRIVEKALDSFSIRSSFSSENPSCEVRRPCWRRPAHFIFSSEPVVGRNLERVVCLNVNPECQRRTQVTVSNVDAPFRVGETRDPDRVDRSVGRDAVGTYFRLLGSWSIPKAGVISRTFFMGIGKAIPPNAQACQSSVFPPYPYFCALVPLTPALPTNPNFFPIMKSLVPTR